MPSTLRKACHACVQAKRKCIPRQPACERCVEKQIQCVYDLEPLLHTDITGTPSSLKNLDGMNFSNGVRHFQMVYDSVSHARDASASAMAYAPDGDPSATHPLLVSDGETASWLMEFFAQIAREGADSLTSPFIHAQIVRGRSLEERTSPTDQEGLALAPEIWNTVSVLQEIHHLLNTALLRLLLNKPSVKKDQETETVVTKLFSTAHLLWSSTDTMSFANMTDWESWLTAETIRRSMFAAIFVRGIWSVAISGFCHYEPFLEALPFDPRAGLWECVCEADWKAVIDRKYDGQHTMLKSWREFTEGAQSDQFDLDEDGRLQRMLHVSFHGSAGIKALQGLDDLYAKPDRC